MNRRRLLTLTASGVSAAALGALGRASPAYAADTIRWVSPRGTIEVLDDYPYWVAKKFGYFGDIQTTLEPGPSDATATVKLVDQKQADVGYPSPGVFSLGARTGHSARLGVRHGRQRRVRHRVPQGREAEERQGARRQDGPARQRRLAVDLRSDAACGGRRHQKDQICRGRLADLGHGAEGRQGRRGAVPGRACARSGKGRGSTSTISSARTIPSCPANSFVIRKADFDDPAKKKLYARYLQGWAAGLEFGKQNPRAATQIVMEQFPGLASQMTPAVATESMMELANVFGGRMDERKKWGYHLPSSWQLFFDTGRKIGQITADIKVEDVCKNDLDRRGQRLRRRQGQGRRGGVCDCPRLSVDRRRVDPESALVVGAQGGASARPDA